MHAYSIVYTNVDAKTELAVSMATLLHTHSGSILANFTSDVRVYDLGSNDDCIDQDVNVELFAVSINQHHQGCHAEQVIRITQIVVSAWWVLVYVDGQGCGL